MAIEVLQQLLGHGSLQSTTIYVNAERRRMRQESANIMRDSPRDAMVRHNVERRST